jgi:hypothetical protein
VQFPLDLILKNLDPENGELLKGEDLIPHFRGT